MAARVRFSVGKGEAVTFTGTHQAGPTNTTPVNIAGWTISVTVRNPDGTTLMTKAGTVTNGAAGQYSWSVTATDTTVTAGERDVEIWRTDSGSERIMAAGVFYIVPDVLNGA